MRPWHSEQESPPCATGILFVSPLPPPPGGMQTWTEILVERGLPEPFKMSLVNTRVTRRHHAIPPRLNGKEILRLLRILWQIQRSLRSRAFSILHLNCSFTMSATPRNLLATWIARSLGINFVIHLHGTFAAPTGSGLASRVYRRAYRSMFYSAAWILALGTPSYCGIMALGDFRKKTTSLMPNFVDFRRSPRKEWEPARDAAPMRVIYTGTLVREKGIYSIVDAAEKLTDVCFQLVGDGPPDSRHSLVRNICERNLQDRVEVMRPVANRDVLSLLARADVFLFPSEREAFPFSVLEAMAVGLPVIASIIGAVPEMVDVPEGGYLIASGDVEACVDALVELRDEPGLRERMGRYNREKAKREYDFDVVVERLCVVYRKILGGAVVGKE